MLEIIFLIDRSGSMSSMASDAIGGYNSFLEKQQRETPDSRLTLIQFDDQYEVLCEGTRVSLAAKLNPQVYIPRGSTALYDAIGKTIDQVGRRLDRTPLWERPDKILFAILTDGYENASLQYESKRIQKMIQHQRDKYSWEFVFLGANQDAIASAASIGIQRSHSINVTHTGAGYRAIGQTVYAAACGMTTNTSLDSVDLAQTYTNSLRQEEETEDPKTS